MEIDRSLFVQRFIFGKSESISLALFRLLFGAVMLLSIIRFWAYGWIEKFYLTPSFHFHYGWFPYVEVPGNWTYLIFLICGLSTLGVTLGFKYRLSIVLFFCSFTFIELLDKTTYLNHYYLVSVLSFILIWLPTHCTYSIDAWRDESIRSEFVPAWQVNILKLMLAIVYIYAGLAKLNSDWMLNAMPLALWLPSKFSIPVIGSWLSETWVHYFFSWTGALYDLSIVFLLMWRRTRGLAFVLVVVFHLLTRVLFPIGVFPYIMICCSTIFLGAAFHRKVLVTIWPNYWGKARDFENNRTYSDDSIVRMGKLILLVFMAVQFVLPLRHLIYSGNSFWTERGYRYSWRVMLMDKTGYANFKIVDGQTQKFFYVQNDDFLSSFQEEQMATQPDFILEYGKYLGNHFRSQGHQNVEVYVESNVALNGRRNQVFISPEANLMELDYWTLCSQHIVPFRD